MTGSETGEIMADNLYRVRCLLVHRMYVLDAPARTTLGEVDDLFLEVVIELLLTYKANAISI